MAKSEGTSIIPHERIDRRIFIIRDSKVLLSHDLAELYEVETRILNQAVSRNRDRFPEDFMFRLTTEEYESLRSQIVISNRGGTRYRPYAFTEQGVAMLSSVLKSERAVRVNIEIMRAFVRLREMLSTNAELSERIEELELRYDGKFRIVFDAIDQLHEQPTKENRRIGFKV
jgi:hypothetical protein